MELRRRWLLLVCSALGIELALYASVAPKVALKAVDFAASQQREPGLTDRVKYLRQLSLEEYAREKLRGCHTVVQGGDWPAFFQTVLEASRGGDAGPFRSRVARSSRHSRPPYPVFFLTGEAPLDQIVDQLRGSDGHVHYLVLARPEGNEYLQATYHTYSSDSFTFGSGIHNAPPAALLYPYRALGLGLIALGCVAYFVLPRKRHDAAAICYSSWTVFLGDVVGMLLFVPFFALPALIIGGAVQALIDAWFLTLVLWPLAFLGAWTMLHMAHYATYEIRVLDAGLQLTTTRGTSTYRFDDMESLQPLVHATPGWLVALSWLAVLVGRGADRIRMSGQALALGGSHGDGLAIRMRDGSAVYLWIPLQGDAGLKNVESLASALRKADIPWTDEGKVIKALVLPDGEDPGARVRKPSQNLVIAGLALLPLVAIAAILGGMWLVEIAGFFVSDPDAPTHREPQAAADARFSPHDATWEKRFRCGPSAMLRAALKDWADRGLGAAEPEPDYNTFPYGFAPVAGAGLLIYGATGPASQADGFAIRTDLAGNLQWEKHYGAGAQQLDAVVAACPAAEGSFLLLGTSGTYSSHTGARRAYLVKIAASGDPQWELFWGDGAEDPAPSDARAEPDGSFTVYGCAGRERHATIFLLQVGSDGKLLTERRLDAAAQLGDVEIRQIRAARDGGFVVTGAITRPGQFKDLLLAKYDRRADVEWQKGFGGTRLERGHQVLESADGGFVAAGCVDEFRDEVRPYLVRVDAQGRPVWQKAVATSGRCEVYDLQATADGGLLLTADITPAADGERFLLVVKADAQGEVQWQKRLRQPGAVYGGVQSIETADGAILVLATRTWGAHQQHSAASLIQLGEVNRQ